MYRYCVLKYGQPIVVAQEKPHIPYGPWTCTKQNLSYNSLPVLSLHKFKGQWYIQGFFLPKTTSCGITNPNSTCMVVADLAFALLSYTWTICWWSLSKFWRKLTPILAQLAIFSNEMVIQNQKLFFNSYFYIEFINSLFFFPCGVVLL